MRALTIPQPWASLIAGGYKHVITQSWPTTYRGLVAIHAAREPASDGIDLIVEALTLYPIDAEPHFAVQEYLYTQPFTLGCVIALADVVDCVRLEPDSWQPNNLERALGDYQPDHYAWMLGKVKRLETPIPARGEQGLWEWAYE